MRFTYVCLSLAMSFLLFGCSEMISKEEVETNWSFQTENGQSFNIVEIQHLMESYIKGIDEEDVVFADYKEAALNLFIMIAFLTVNFFLSLKVYCHKNQRISTN